MLILKLAIRNIRRNTRKTLLLGTLIAVGMAFLFFANAVFESANQGVENSFVSSLTGDAVIGAKTENQFSLFGNEIPVVDDYEVIPSIMGYSELSFQLDGLEYAGSYTPVVSAAAALEAGDYRDVVAIFGIVPESYFKVCSSVEIVYGNPEDIADGGIFICESVLKKIEEENGHKLELGEPIKLSLFSNGSFKIRKGIFAGCHRYVNKVSPFDSIILADPSIVRGLIDYTAGYMAKDSGSKNDENSAEDFNMDSLFEEAVDVTDYQDNGFSLSAMEAMLADTAERDAVTAEATSAWSFILLKSKENSRQLLMQELNAINENSGYNLAIKSWRQGAGISAQMVFALQTAFNIGIIFIIIGAVLVIMNALMISVLERSFEIGTMRGIGAGKPFISALFIAESMILTMSAALVGIVLGVIVSFSCSGGIHLHNSLLVTMFGGDVLIPTVTFRNIVLHLGGAAVVGAFSWIYPVYVAVKIQPVTIMGRR